MNVPYAQWEDVLPVLTENSIAAAAHAEAPLAMTDNLYAYGPTDGLITEDTPHQAPGPKGKIRVRSLR